MNTPWKDRGGGTPGRGGGAAGGQRGGAASSYRGRGVSGGFGAGRGRGGKVRSSLLMLPFVNTPLYIMLSSRSKPQRAGATSPAAGGVSSVAPNENEVPPAGEAAAPSEGLLDAAAKARAPRLVFDEKKLLEPKGLYQIYSEFQNLPLKRTPASVVSRRRK